MVSRYRTAFDSVLAAALGVLLVAGMFGVAALAVWFIDR